MKVITFAKAMGSYFRQAQSGDKSVLMDCKVNSISLYLTEDLMLADMWRKLSLSFVRCPED